MGNFFQEFLVSLGMRRGGAVQQESRSLSSGLSPNSSNNKKKKTNPVSLRQCCLVIVLISPLIFMTKYLLGMYHDMVQYEQQHSKKDTLVVTTSLGAIKIEMRPDLSRESVDYIHRVVASGRCDKCNFYRIEEDGILQGIMEAKDIPVHEVFGPCPLDAESVKNKCPEWNPDCGCHGPVMTRGSVAWAAGDPGGPDFFINAYNDGDAVWWGTQHTNFGFIDDPASMAIVDQMLVLETYEESSLDYLVEEIEFHMALE